MKLASNSAAIMHNSVESGHLWWSPRISVKGSDKEPIRFNFGVNIGECNFNHLSWNLSPYCISELLRRRKDKIPINSIKGFDTSITSRIVERVSKVFLFFNSSWLVFTYYCIYFFLCSGFLRIVVFNIVFITFVIYERYGSGSRTNTHGASFSPG